jgi:hypothetical protein
MSHLTNSKPPQASVAERGLLGLVVVLFPTLLLAVDAEYPVRLFVPHKVGNQRTVQKKLTQTLDRVAKKGDKVIQESHVKNEVEFAGTVETLAVDGGGRETQVLLTIDKLVLTAGKDKPQEAVKPGTVVTAELKGGKTLYSPKEKGQEISALATQLLPRILGLTTEPVSEERFFETKKPQKIGATWPADTERLVKMLRAADPKLKPDAVMGSAQLLGVRKIDGKDCLEVQLTVSFQMPGQAPAGFVPVETALKANIRILIPADYSTGAVEQHPEVAIKQVFKGKPGSAEEGVVFEGSTTEASTTRTTYLKK